MQQVTKTLRSGESLFFHGMVMMLTTDSKLLVKWMTNGCEAVLNAGDVAFNYNDNRRVSYTVVDADTITVVFQHDSKQPAFDLSVLGCWFDLWRDEKPYLYTQEKMGYYQKAALQELAYRSYNEHARKDMEYIHYSV